MEGTLTNSIVNMLALPSTCGAVRFTEMVNSVTPLLAMTAWHASTCRHPWSTVGGWLENDLTPPSRRWQWGL